MLLLSILFPPWKRMVVYHGSPSIIRCWILSNPNYCEGSMLALSVEKMIFESCSIVLITVGLLVILRKIEMKRNPSSSIKKK